MRIAIALEYPLMQQGGTEVLVRALLRGLGRHFEIVLVSGDPGRSGLPRELSELVAAHFHWGTQPKTAGAARELAEKLSQQKISLAHFHFGGTYEWRSNRFWRCPVYHLARHGVPCISTNHLANEWLNCGAQPARPVWQKHFYQLFAILSRSQIYRHLKFEICVSRHDQRRVRRQFPFFKHKIIQLYHSLLDANEPMPPSENREPVILCVGTIGGRKAQPVLVEAFSRIAEKFPAWRLDLIGRVSDDNDAERIQKIIHEKNLGGRVCLLGRLDDAETVRRMKRAAIFAIPSLQEGLGLSLQEATFYGCVAIGTRAGGIPELIDDGQNGLLVEPGNANDLAAALGKMISDDVFRARCAARARQSILDKGMTLERMLGNYRKIYKTILDSI
jgi:glycosyltransferase involved in cell wall biosynthesis